MWRSLHDAWWRLATLDRPRTLPEHVAAGVLSAAAAGYGVVVACRNTAYRHGWRRSVRLPVPVVSIGNLTVGGTGKTPCVALVADRLAARGHRVGVLSRGYGGARRRYWLRADNGRLVVDGDPAAPVALLADEPQVLAARLHGVPVIVDPSRARGARQALALGCDVLILDDGFQHRQVRRDCDIVLVAARTPPAGWPLLPRGVMREPFAALARAQVIILTKAERTPEELRARVRAINPDAPILTATHEPDRLADGVRGHALAVARLAGAPLALVSSIGDPDGFAEGIRRLGGQVAAHVRFPDHHRYGADDVEEVRRRAAAAGAAVIVTTEKDWVRLQPVLGGRAGASEAWWVLGVRMRVTEGDDALNARLAALRAA